MAITIYDTEPDGDGVRLAPATFSLTFRGEPDRASIEKALSLSPARGPLHFRWDTRIGPSVVPVHPTLPTSGGPILTALPRITVLLAGTWAPDTTYTVRLDKTIARAADGSSLAADHVFTFSTRIDGVDHYRPAIERRAVVLSGGGAKGSFQAGVLDYLYNHEGFFPDIVVGVSVGAINGARLAMASTPDQHRAAAADIVKFWRELRENEDVIKPHPELRAIADLDGLKGDVGDLVGNLMGAAVSAAFPLAGLVGLLGFGIAAAGDLADLVKKIDKKLALVDQFRKHGSVYSFQPLLELLTRRLDVEQIRQNPRVKLALGAVNLFTGRTEFFDNSSPDLIGAVLASAAAPVFFPQAHRGNDVYTDGGVREVAGVRRAIELGATDVVVIPTYRVNGWPGLEPRYQNLRFEDIAEVGLRAGTQLPFDEMLGNDVEGVTRELAVKVRYGEADVRIRVIDPQVDLQAMATFHPEAIRRSISYGQGRAAQLLSNQPAPKAPQPLGPTRTSFRLVVDVRDADGDPILDDRCFHMFDGTVTKPVDTAKTPSVRIIVKDAGGQIVQAYPSDELWSYEAMVVPGSDPDLVIMPLDPKLPKQRRGLVYAMPLHGRERFGVEVTVSGRRDGHGYEPEAVGHSVVSLDPDANGVMVHQVRVAWPKGRRKSRSAMLSTRHQAEPPGLVIHGEGDLPDLDALRGFGGPLLDGHGKVTGRWEGTRDANDLHHPSDQLIRLRAARVFHAGDVGVMCTVFAQPNFGGAHVAIGFQSGFDDVGFPIRSARVVYVSAGGGGG